MSEHTDTPGGPARPPRRPRAGETDRPGGGPISDVHVPGPDDIDGTADAGEPVHGYDEYDDHWDDDHHDYVDLPPHGSARKWVTVLVVLGLLVGVVVGGGWWWYQRQIDPPGSPGASVSVEIPSGSTSGDIGTILEREGVIANATVFGFYASGKDSGGFQAGTYVFRRNSDLDLVLRTLATGPRTPVAAEADKVTIPEGYTVRQMVARIAEKIPRLKAADLQAALDDGTVTSPLRPVDQPSYEGLLFPATYEVEDDQAAADVLDRLAAEMDTRVGAVDLEATRARLKETWGLDLSTYDLLKVASMVQAEAGNAEEAPKVAAVIYNRLAQGMPLGIDAVDQYGAELAGKAVDYQDAGAPYNTRRRAGLPPTPISAPGEYALAAAANPADGPWLYYVLSAPGQHVFVTTNAEFLAAKADCRAKGLGCG